MTIKDKVNTIRTIAANSSHIRTSTGYPATLSKTLAKLPESITVYGNTGGVGDAPDLPSGYTQLEYIESTGTQYINTNLKGKNSIRAVLDVVYTATNSQRLFGSRIDSKSSEFNISSTSGSIYIGYGNIGYTANAIEIDKRYTIDLNQKNLYINGKLIYTFRNVQEFNNNLDMLLMASNYNGTISSNNNFKGLLYRCQIFDNDVLQQNYIPAKRNSDNEIGMYDTVHNVFYTNQGTDSFIAGSAIYKIPILFGTLPAGYTELSYIEATGTQYINTGVVPTLNTQVDYKVRFAEGAAGSSPLIGARTGGTNNNRFIPIGYTSTFANYRTVLGTAALGEKINFSLDYTGSFQPQNNKSIVNNTEYNLTGHGYTKSQDYNLYLFAISGYGANLYRSKGRMYYCRIYDNGTLVRNFVPAKRNSNGVVGMYDTVNNVFYKNADSSGDNFVAGAEIPHKTINLYSDAALGANDSLVVSPTAQTASRGSTDVKALQDWDQDWKIPKADELMVSAGTTVQPSSMQLSYWSKSKN